MLEAFFELFLKWIFELLLYVPGYLILRCFRKESEVEIESMRTLGISVLFWLVAAAIVLRIVL